jgi:uncharacterized protein (UPF0276 family)
MKYVKAFENYKKFNGDVTNMYKKFGKKYPLASDLIAYYIYNYKDSDNDILKYIKKHAPELSALAMDYENSWVENMETIEDAVKDIINEPNSNESVEVSKKNVKDILDAINKIEKIFDEEYIPNLKTLIKDNEIDKRLLDHASDVTNDFAALKSWAIHDFSKRIK